MPSRKQILRSQSETWPLQLSSLNSNSNVPTAQSDDRLVRETRVTVILIFYLCTICISALHVYVLSTPEILWSTIRICISLYIYIYIYIYIYTILLVVVVVVVLLLLLTIIIHTSD